MPDKMLKRPYLVSVIGLRKSNVSVTRTKLGLRLTLFFKFFIHFTYLLRPIPCDGLLCSALMQADGLVPASAYSLSISDVSIASSLGALMVFQLCNKVRGTL